MKLMATRREELGDIERGMHIIREEHEKAIKELAEASEQLAVTRAVLPATMFAVLQAPELTQKQVDHLRSSPRESTQWLLRQILNKMPRTMTDAEKLRLKEPNKLTKRERLWRKYDKILNPSKWAPLSILQGEKDIAELRNAEEEERALSITKEELQRIMEVPVDDLIKQEREIRGILLSINDKRHSDYEGDLANTARYKDPIERTAEEREFIILDAVLNSTMYEKTRLQREPTISNYTRNDLLALRATEVRLIVDPDDAHSREILDKYL